MKVTKLFSIASGILFVAAVMRAAGADSAVQAWQSLKIFSPSPPPMSWSTNPPTRADLDKFDDQREAETAAFADKAREFYTRFPNDTNAVPAQLMEIQALQSAIRMGATNRVADLAEREQSIAGNTKVPTEVRYELRVDLLGREIQSEVTRGTSPMAELEKAGRALVKEFPGGPAGYDLLGQVAENADLAKMQELGKVMAGSGGPPALTERGNGLLRRLAIVGKPFPIEFQAADGRDVNARALSNKVVLVDFWATWCPLCVDAVPDIKKLYEKFHAQGFEIVGINFDDTTNAAQRFVREQNLPWPEFFGGRDNPYGRDYALNFLPAAWLVDRKGIVQDIHGTVNLEAKVEKLMGQ